MARKGGSTAGRGGGHCQAATCNQMPLDLLSLTILKHVLVKCACGVTTHLPMLNHRVVALQVQALLIAQHVPMPSDLHAL